MNTLTRGRTGAGITHWWQQREPRERLMLGTMVLAIAAFVAWYGVFVPARHWRDAAQRRHDQAAAELLGVRQELATLRASAGPARSGDQLLASAHAAGVRVARQQAGDAGGVVLEIDDVAAAQLFAWLDALHADGIAPRTLDIRRDGTQLDASVGFALDAP